MAYRPEIEEEVVDKLTTIKPRYTTLAQFINQILYDYAEKNGAQDEPVVE